MLPEGVAGIRIRFHNPNEFANEFRIYRKEENFDENDLPNEPIVVLPSQPIGTVSYIDEDVEGETDYYYMVSAVFGSLERFSFGTVKARADAGPSAIAEPYGGGLYAGNIYLDENYGLDQGTYAIIVATEDAGNPSLQWKTAGTNTSNTNDNRDGWANTLAMIAAGIESHPAAEHCVNWRGGGHDDWYLGAQEEWEEIYKNRNVNNLWSELALPTSDYIWSSTQNSSNRARSLNASLGSWDGISKAYEYVARPIRRIKLMV